MSLFTDLKPEVLQSRQRLYECYQTLGTILYVNTLFVDILFRLGTFPFLCILKLTGRICYLHPPFYLLSFSYFLVTLNIDTNETSV